jgi:hypothetical protein
MTEVADAIRQVTAAIQKQLDRGDRSRQIDAEDLIDILLTIAERLDPPLRSTKRTNNP